MPIQVATHTEKVRKYPLVVGTAILTPKALNPDLEQLKELGLVDAESKQEPQYLITSNQGVDWRIVSIWLGGQNNVLNVKTGKPEAVEILAELRILLKKDAGPLYINHNGRFAGEQKKSSLGPTARLEHQGEHKLIDFIKALGHVGYDNECYIENIQALVIDGDMSELGAMLSQATQAGFKVRVALGVENGQYQRVNSEAYAFDNANTLTYFYAQLAKQSAYAGDAYFGSFHKESSTLQVMKATELRYYNEVEAMEHEDAMQKRKEAANVTSTASRPAPSAASYPSSSQPSAEQEAAMYEQPGMRVGGPLANAAAPATTAPPPPISSDDDNDLPF